MDRRAQIDPRDRAARAFADAITAEIIADKITTVTCSPLLLCGEHAFDLFDKDADGLITPEDIKFTLEFL